MAAHFGDFIPWVDFTINVEFTDSSGNQLGVLRTKI